MNLKEEERRARLLKMRAERLPDIKKQFEEAQKRNFNSNFAPGGKDEALVKNKTGAKVKKPTRAAHGGSATATGKNSALGGTVSYKDTTTYDAGDTVNWAILFTYKDGDNKDWYIANKGTGTVNDLGGALTFSNLAVNNYGGSAISGWTAVPEPTSGLLLLLGVAGLALKRKRA